MKVANGLQMAAGVIGPWSVNPQDSPVSIVLFAGTGYPLFCSPALGVVGLVVILLAAHALKSSSVTETYVAGLIGLVLFPFFFLGTTLSLGSLALLLFSGKRKKPRTRLAHGE